MLSDLNSSHTFLYQCETIDMVESINAAVSSSKQILSATIDLILPDGMSPIFSNTGGENQLENDPHSQIRYYSRIK